MAIIPHSNNSPTTPSVDSSVGQSNNPRPVTDTKGLKIATESYPRQNLAEIRSEKSLNERAITQTTPLQDRDNNKDSTSQSAPNQKAVENSESDSGYYGSIANSEDEDIAKMSDFDEVSLNIENMTNSLKDLPPFKLSPNPKWIDPKTRPSCKYSPVLVDKVQSSDARNSMELIHKNRIDICKALKVNGVGDQSGWFSFNRGRTSESPESTRSVRNSKTIPTIVLSGGSANKIAIDLEKDKSLAWHPSNMRGEPVYLFVHQQDYPTYKAALKEALEKYPTLEIIGWSAGGNDDTAGLTGFGAARAAALDFANSLPYQPEKLTLADQDVVETEETRATNPLVRKKIDSIHERTNKDVVGFGVGYPTRESVPKPFSETSKSTKEDLNSPTQQFVSIRTANLKQGVDTLYPSYMVAGGEDMLMGQWQKVMENGINTTLPHSRIIKKSLQGPPDPINRYWNESRIKTLEAIYEMEQHININFEGQELSLRELMDNFESKGWIKSSEREPTTLAIVERVILRINKLNKI